MRHNCAHVDNHHGPWNTRDMNLKTYIQAIGDEEAAERFGVKPRTTRSWRLGERQPRPSQVPQIIAGSNGRLTWESIYMPTHKAA